ncbi:CHASE2 domain-containing protein [Candidatus Methylobacter favarea]|nr:adenylate/guanylate cyclase domain-containing protein [Candidatus Methylobacter favarea]
MSTDASGIPIYAYFFIGIVAFLAVIPLNYLGGFFQNLELSAYDRMLSLQSAAPYNPPITLITITDDDLIRLQRSAIPDGTLFDILIKLIAYHPRAIGVDLYRDIPLPPHTDKLEELLKEHSEIIVARKYGDAASGGISPPAYLLNPDQAGCTDLPIDSDNSIRRALIYLGDNEICYSLGYLLALRYLAYEGISALGDADQPDSLRLGRSSLPRLRSNDGGYQNMDDKGYQILLDFQYQPTAFPTYSLGDALDNRMAAADLEGKIVLIGSVAESSRDFFSIPGLSQDAISQKTAGVKMHGLLADQLVRAALYGHQPFRTVPEWLEWLWIWFCCMAGVLIGRRQYPLQFFVLVQALGLVGGAGTVYSLFRTGIWIPMVPSSLGWLFSTTFTTAWLAHREHQQRDALMSLFARHVSSPIANEIWQHRGEILKDGILTPQRMTATVFFSDLVNFTHIAENLDPKIFIVWINEYLDAMTSIISSHDGVIIRFMGDGIMAAFGVPLPRTSAALITSDATRAVSCALAIQDKLIHLNQNWAARNLPVVTMRIGLNTGPLLAGSLGNKERLEYTIHGDTVNTAARLESYDKEGLAADYFVSPCRILISATTEQHLSPAFYRTSLGSVALKGKNKCIEVFRLES